MTARRRVLLLVALAALVAAGATVAATVLTSTGTEASAPATSSTGRVRAGAPPLLLDLGVRTDPEARALRRAAALYARGRRRQAARVFGRRDSLEARVGAAFSAWPEGLGRLEALAGERPRSALVQLHLGLGLYWVGRSAAARAAWRHAKALDPDSSYAVRAGDLLHPELPIPGLPFFIPSFPSPPALAKLTPPRQLRFLAARARRGGAHDKLLLGTALQRLGRPISAEREFLAAAALAPDDPDARVAAAVGLFDKDRPELAFGRLGPLTRSFPKAPTVRFHLAVLLLWLGRVEDAKRQFRQARDEAPSSRLGREATRFLTRLESVGTNR